MSTNIKEQDIKALMKLKPGITRTQAISHAKMLMGYGLTIKEAIKRAATKTEFSKNKAMASRPGQKYVHKPNKPVAKKSTKSASKGVSKKGKACPKPRKPRDKCKYGSGKNGSYKAPKGCPKVAKCNRKKTSKK